MFYLKEPFYSEGEGFIEFRLKTMRQSAKRGGGPTSQVTKKKKKDNDTDDDADQPSAEVQEQVGAMYIVLWQF